jgi:hypothetical protein
LLGRRWTSTDPDATVVPFTAGMYLLYVAFEGTRDVTFVRGTDDPSGQTYRSTTDPRLLCRFLDSTIEDRDSAAYFESNGGPSPDVASYAWSAELLLVQDLDALRPRIRILYPQEGDGIWDYPRRVGQDPEWTASYLWASARFQSSEGVGTGTWVIETRQLAGDPFTEASVPHPANASTTRSLSRPKFSPDGNHIAYQVQRNGTGTTYTIHRDEVGGNQPANLTPAVRNAAAGEAGMVLVAWR